MAGPGWSTPMASLRVGCMRMTGGRSAPPSASYHPGGFCARRLLSSYVPAGGRAPVRGRGQLVAPAGRRFQRLVDRPKVLAGRLPLPDRADEVALDQRGAAILHLHVGSTLAMEAIRTAGPPGARKLRERVVGIIV